jgi:flagellum-specific ATP synthase
VISLADRIGAADRALALGVSGVVVALRGLTLLVEHLPLPVGSLVRVEPANGQMARGKWGQGRRGSEPLFADLPFATSPGVPGEIVGFDGGRAIVMVMGSTEGIRPGDRVVGEQTSQSAPIGPGLLGRVIDGLGRPIDGLGPVHDTAPREIMPAPVPAMRRRRINRALHTGIRGIDLFATLGRGQRIGIFAGPGVGKSTLLGQIARASDADVNVIALVGERGREVRDFIETVLGPEGLAKSVVVVATSDESPLLRLRAAKLACAAAEWFREQGRDALLVMDSVTRFAHAQRQVGLSVGEPPATRGYTPSVFASLPLLLERAGAIEGGGSITGLYTILVEGDDLTEPVADACRGVLDGHLILSRDLAERGHYPALDVLASVSRIAEDVTDERHAHARRQILRLLAAYRKSEDLIQIGAYARGSDPETDIATDYYPRLMELLQQGRGETEGFERARDRLIRIAIDTGEKLRVRLAQRDAARAKADGQAGAAQGGSRAAARPGG